MLDEVTLTEDKDTNLPLASVKPPAPDRYMTILGKLLRVDRIDHLSASERSGQRYFQISLAITGLRCLITYLLVPIVVPIIGLSGAVSAPVGIALSLVAIVTGAVSLRKFWRSRHRLRWVYTAFITVVFMVLAVSLYFDISKIFATT